MSSTPPTSPILAPLPPLGCPHYQRGASIIAACCGKEYGCRLCHDESELHEIDRHAIAEMVCLRCSTRQPIGPVCRHPGCGATLARYYCEICRFLDDSATRHPYHCDRCGICRLREPGVDYHHCDGCGTCINASTRDSHPCYANALHSNCPVCSEWLQTSVQKVIRMRCGHYIHAECFDQFLQHTTTYACPLCSRSILEEESRSILTQQFDDFIEIHRTPDEYADWRSEILCNDCLEKADVAFQVTQYHKCPRCGHYNTAVVGRTVPNR